MSRRPADAVERLGVARSRAALERAELALVVVDGSKPLSDQDRAALAAAAAAERVLVLVNKADLPRKIDLSELNGYEFLSVSAKTQAGLPELEHRVGQLFARNSAPNGELLTNARQAEAVGRAAKSLQGVQSALDAGMPPDAVLADVEDALAALGQVTGRQVSEDVTDRIFSRFCVGK
ncbi:MAG: hypothetical protein LUG64_06480 [Clostridiales bacterium]|nr:hypothetical protein [Clostridiales bacterium]